MTDNDDGFLVSHQTVSFCTVRSR